MPGTNAAHRHRNGDGDPYTHRHDHEPAHCSGDCDAHEELMRPKAQERISSAK
jgi:hypothetical protein